MTGNTQECRRALNTLRDDPLATKWDAAWANTVEAQHARTGTFLPLHDAAVTYTPVTNTAPPGSFWPQSAAPEKELPVCDVSHAAPEQEFAQSVLQGLVNRVRPRLYLLHTRYARQDQQWLDELHHEGYSSRSITSADPLRRADHGGDRRAGGRGPAHA